MSKVNHHRTAILVRLTLLVAVSFLCAGWLGSSERKSHRSAGFDDTSLHGSYSLVGTGGDHDAASVGVTRFDGDGRASRTLILNERDPGGDGRIVLPIPAKGRYKVNRDGTGTAVFVNELPDGQTVRFRFDFVITEATSRGSGRPHLGLDLYMVQREPGIAASLVTFELSRLPS